MASAVAAASTIVWEFQADIPGMHAPFSDKVSNFIEEKYSLNQNTLVDLQQIEPTLKDFSIDTGRMVQLNASNGSQRKIRRSLYNRTSSLGIGIAWEWMTDLGWVTYDVDTLDVIEDAFSNNVSEGDLRKLKYHLPNIVAIDKGYQRNLNTNFVRPIQRRAVAYKTTAPSVNNTNAGRSHTNPRAPIKPPYPSSHTNGAASRSSQGAGGGSRSSANNQMGIMKFCNLVVDVADDAECAICLIPFHESDDDDDGNRATSSSTQSTDQNPVVELNKCKHCYHQQCMDALYKQGPGNGCIQCPICKTIHGVKMGNQPPGTMDVRIDPRSSVSGYHGQGMIIITYNIRSGIQGSNDPSPGVPYQAHGFPRTAFLPANVKGNKVLKLLKLAWERKLIFTIGTSTTTGIDNSVVWNEIHHKTSPRDNGSGHGYPDPTYLDNVIEEMKQHGVVDDGSF